MLHVMLRRSLLLLAVSSLFTLLPPRFDGRFEVLTTKAQAQDQSTAEKDAFSVAKELGTVDAWDAFLKSYPAGFYADLARAYVKKLAGTTPTPQATQQPPPQASPQPAPIDEPVVSSSIPNVAGISVVTYDGGSFTMIRPGTWREQRDNGITLDYTEISRTSDGIELQADSDPNVIITLDVQGRSVLRREGGSKNRTLYEIRTWDRSQNGQNNTEMRPARRAEPEPERYSEPPLRCGKNYKKVGGECVLMQNCGANAYRSAEGDCYCNKNYQMRNGKCVWKQDKQGFEVAPWKKSGCRSLDWNCKQGNAAACQKYEETCQVN